jgi:hypothetical protein
MHKELVNAKGLLTMDFYYAVNDVPVRAHYDKRYQPDTVHVRMNVGKSFGSRLPDLDGLSVGDLLGEGSPVASVDLAGKRLKKDGTPGSLTVTEHLYGYSHGDSPPWVHTIINQILLSLA